jgi:hypothetical protein
MQGFADRLGTIKAVNGYATNIETVFYDEIPMGLQIQDDFLPAIILIDSIDTMRMEQGCAIGTWEFELQLWETRVVDTKMHNFTRDVVKAVYANSPSATTTSEFRTIHPSIRQVKLVSVTPDLNMIEANRVYCLTFQVEYQTKIFNL